MKLRPFFVQCGGSALVTTLLVIVVLTIIVTAFLQSMTIERQTAHSYLNRYRAELAADAGKNDAIYLLRDLFTKYPDSVTWWDPDLAGKGVAGTAFSYYATETATDSTKATDNNSFYIPLTSGATAQMQSAKGQSMVLTGAELDLNSPKNLTLLENGDPWIGSVPGQTPPVVKVPWVYLTDNGNPSKRIARYAFWIEDNSFRVNVNVAGKTARGADSVGRSPSEVPLQGAFTGSGLASGEATTLAGSVVDLRTRLGEKASDQKLLSTSQINYAASPPSDTNYKQSRFLLTLFSGGANLSRIGARRVDLNVLNAADSTKIGKDDIQDDIEQIKATINYRPPDAAAPSNPSSQYTFGHRFYRTSPTVTNDPVTNDTDREIYVTKIAANIRDYIDADSNPSQIDDSGEVVIAQPSEPVGGIVTSSVPAENDFWAIGQENVPRLTKAMVHVAQVQPMSSSSTTFKIRISYYLEFWNLGTKDIVLGGASNDTQTGLDADTFIRIGNQPGWMDRAQAGGDVIPPGRDYDIPLSSFGKNLTFPAGKLTVLTTDKNPDYKASLTFLNIKPDAVHVSEDLDAQQLYPNLNYPNDKIKKSSLSGYGGNPTLDCHLRPTIMSSPVATVQWDAETYVLLGNSKGILDSERSAVTIKPGIFIDTFGTKNDTKSMHFRGGTLPGNFSSGFDMRSTAGGASGGFPYQVGDPRASLDVLEFNAIGGKPNSQAEPGYSHAFPSFRDESSQSANTYKLYSVLSQSRVTGGANTMATSPGTNPYPASSDQKKRWDDAGSTLDFSANDPNAPGSVATIADAKLKSI